MQHFYCLLKTSYYPLPLYCLSLRIWSFMQTSLDSFNFVASMIHQCYFAYWKDQNIGPCLILQHYSHQLSGVLICFFRWAWSIQSNIYALRTLCSFQLSLQCRSRYRYWLVCQIGASRFLHLAKWTYQLDEANQVYSNFLWLGFVRYWPHYSALVCLLRFCLKFVL